MGSFTVPTMLSNPGDPDRRITLDLIVDTGAVYTMLPAEVVEHGEEWPNLFFEGPPGSLALLGALTLEGFALAPPYEIVGV